MSKVYANLSSHLIEYLIVSTKTFLIPSDISLMNMVVPTSCDRTVVIDQRIISLSRGYTPFLIGYMKKSRTTYENMLPFGNIRPKRVKQVFCLPPYLSTTGSSRNLLFRTEWLTLLRQVSIRRRSPEEVHPLIKVKFSHLKP